MLRPITPLLIIGGNSAIGRHILQLVPEARALARTSDSVRVEAIGSYFEAGPDTFKGVRAVINCAGIINGTEDELRRVNADLQQSLAEKARAAGVLRYVAISSFAIFGASRRISQNLGPAPINAYGRSKVEGERRLASLQTDAFRVLNVAFPAIVGTNRLGKVERMLRLWRRAGVWLAPAGDIQRSMIGAQAAAHVLVAAAGSERIGRVLAADPQLFTYRTAQRWMREDLGSRCRVMSVPAAVEALLRRAAPQFHRSLMTNSVLEPNDNFMLAQGLESSLRTELVAAVKRATNA